jgi:hypothetical protein
MARPQPRTVTVAITFADDTVGLMTFVTHELAQDGSVLWHREATAENIDREIARCSFDADKRPIKGWVPVDARDVPADRTFRNALRHDGERFHHDLTHARTLWREEIRQARAGKLARLDVAYQRADERGDHAEKQRLAKEKQVLRDLPAHPAIDAAQTTADLQAFWPPELRD